MRTCGGDCLDAVSTWLSRSWQFILFLVIGWEPTCSYYEILDVNNTSITEDSSSSLVKKYLSSLGPQPYTFEDLESITSNFSNKVGFGGYGEVYKGQLPGGMQVAVKVLTEKDVIEESFMAEVSTMGNACHRNLVKLYGYCFEDNMKALLYEYMENGSLDKILYENSFDRIEWEKLYNIAIGTANGLYYLHDCWDKQIIHYDIKASNVLLDKNLCPKITDFGLAKLMNRDVTHVPLTRIRGTLGYNAPETWMPGSEVTCKCDVYSFGMMLFEVLGNRSNGLGENWFPAKVWQKFEKGQLEYFLRDCGITEKDYENAKLLSLVALWCAQYTPEIRPSMKDVVLMLEKKVTVERPPCPFQYGQSLKSSMPPSVLETVPEEYSKEHERVKEKVSSIESEPSAEVLASQSTPTIYEDPSPAVLSLGKSESEERTRRSIIMKQQENHGLLAKCISQNLGFSAGKPVTACLIYKCLLHWKSFEAERTSVFDLIIQAIGIGLEDQENNDSLSYWLSNTSTLVLLLQHTLKATGASSLAPQRRATALTSLFGRITQGLRGPPQNAGISFLNIEAKYPAFLFKEQLIAYLEKIFKLIRDNLKQEVYPMLALCIQAPRNKSRARLGKGSRSQQDSPVHLESLAHWESIQKILNNYVKALRKNYVPPFLVGKVFTQIFSFINVQLFNSLLLRRECCSLINGEFVKHGLLELENWCFTAIKEYAGSAWDELKHIRQAVGFLVIHQKNRMTLEEIRNDLCPVLNVQQLYRISTMYWDDISKSNSVSSEVISSLRVMMSEDLEDFISSQFLLEDDSSLPFTIHEFSMSTQLIDIADIDPPPLLRENSEFHFLLQPTE